jgi:hypothetical protein
VDASPIVNEDLKRSSRVAFDFGVPGVLGLLGDTPGLSGRCVARDLRRLDRAESAKVPALEDGLGLEVCERIRAGDADRAVVEGSRAGEAVLEAVEGALAGDEDLAVVIEDGG